MYLFIVIACLSALSIKIEALDIIKDAKAGAEIVIPDKPLAVEKAAAEELAYHILKATGVKLNCRKESAPQNKKMNSIYLGKTILANKHGLVGKIPGLNGYVIQIIGSDIFIVGDDSTGQVFGPLNRNQTHIGTLLGVYKLLRKEMEVSWLWPGELGEVIPQSKNIAFNLQCREKPFLQHTRLRTQEVEFGWKSPENARKYFHDRALWLRRHGFSSALNLDYPHGFTDYWKRFSKSHLDFFQMLPTGKRGIDPNYAGGTGKNTSLCVSNPELHKQIVKDWLVRRRPGKDWLNAKENDSPGMCVCEKCLAWDEKPQRDLSSLAKAYQEDGKNWHRLLGAVSNRYAHFWLAVQKAAQQYDPNVIVYGLAYTNYAAAPTVKLNKNIRISICPNIMYPMTKELSEGFKKNWQRWYNTGALLNLRPNYFLTGHNMPIFFAERFGNDFTFAAERGMFATDFDSLTGQWGTQGPNLYMLGCKNLEPLRPTQEILAEYYKGFGSAAKEVKTYFKYWQRISDAVTVEEANKWDISWGNFYINADHIFTPQVMCQGKALLEKAFQAAKNNPVDAKRVAFLQKGLENAELVLEAQRAARAYEKDKNAWKPFAHALEKLDAFRARVESDNIANMAPLVKNETMTFRRRLMQRKLTQTPDKSLKDQRRAALEILKKQAPRPSNAKGFKTWKFMWDPVEEGEDMGWDLPVFDDSSWYNIGVNTWWEKQDVGKAWAKKHGYNYDGLAWYRTSFKIDTPHKGQKVLLVFGAVDEACRVWLNGKLLLKRPYPYQGNKNSWGEPFEIDITGQLHPNAWNTVAVEVEDRAGAGGIWKGVSLKTCEQDK